MPAKNTYSENIDLIVDMAEELSSELPYEAHFLLQLAQAVRPNGPRIQKLLADLEPKPQKDWIVSWRHDGLCERLSSILVGYFTAKHLKLDFRFTWPDNSFLNDHFQSETNIWHDLPSNPRAIFSESFTEIHLISEESVLHPTGQFSFLRKMAKRITITSFDKVKADKNFIRPCWLASNRTFPDLQKVCSYSDFRKLLFEDILSESILKDIFSARDVSLPRRRIALHVRGGDIVYGKARLSHGFSRLKSIPLPLAEYICEIYEERGYNIFLFGASDPDLRYLAKRYSNAVHLADSGRTDLPGYAKVILDVLFMSECDEIVSSADTAVTKLAELLGPARLVPVSEMFTQDKEHEVLHARTLTGDFEGLHSLQRAFIFWCVFVTCPATTSYEVRLKYVQCAYNSDPENTRYLLFTYLLKIISGSVDDSDRDLEIILERLEIANDGWISKKNLRRIGVNINDRILVSLLFEIDASSTVPEKARSLVQSILKHVSPRFHKKNIT